MDQRREFVRLAILKGANRRELCKQFGIRPDTGYRWLARHVAGDEELADRSRRPCASPRQCSAHIETRVLSVRDANVRAYQRFEKEMLCVSRRDGLPGQARQ